MMTSVQVFETSVTSTFSRLHPPGRSEDTITSLYPLDSNHLLNRHLSVTARMGKARRFDFSLDSEEYNYGFKWRGRLMQTILKILVMTPKMQ